MYQVGSIITGGIVFLGSWIYCAATYGFLFGFGLGWIPSAILAVIVGALWPVVAILLVLAFALLLR
jgi:hypothetical protein